MKINILYEFNDKLKSDWKLLEKNTFCTPFQSYEWHLKWHENIGKKINSTPVLIIIKNNKKIIGIFPFCLVKKNFHLKIIWHGGLQTDYNLPLIHKNYFNIENIFLIWELVKKYLPNHDLLYLEKQPQYILEKENFFLKIQSINQQFNCYRVLFIDSWDNYYKNLSLKLRNDNKRQINRLKKIGKLDFFICNNDKEKNQLIKTMIKQKSERYISTNSWDMFSESYNKKFYFELNKNSNNIGQIHCSGIKLNNEIISTHVGIVSDECFYYILPAFNQKKYGKYSPGKILLEKLLFWTFNNNIKIFDFTGGNELYKNLWNNNKFPIYQSLTSNSNKGKIILLLLYLKNTLKKFPLIKKIYYYLKNLK